MRSSLPSRSPRRLSWKMVKRTVASPLLVGQPREELRERHVDRLEEALLHLGRRLHEALLQVEGGLRALHAVDREARIDDVVEVVGVVLAGERAQRDHAVLLLALVARLRG